MNDKEIQKALEGNRNLFITGQAGTGKSYLLRQYINNNPNTIVCAPTGIAATNIGGTTCHRVFGIPIDCAGQRITKKQDSAIRILAMANAVVVDEISMCRNDVFSFMIRVLRKAEKKKGSKIRLIVSGDFSQLPPVVSKNDEKVLRKNGLDISGYPFTCKEWESCHFKTIELTDVHRQEDPEFIKYLNYIRAGSVRGIKYFQQFVMNDQNTIADIGLSEDVIHQLQNGEAIYVCGTNSEAEKINEYCLNEINSLPIAYKAETTGRVTSDAAPMDSMIMLKKGEHVIFTVNDVINDDYQNGTLGVVEDYDADGVTVKLSDGNEVSVGKHTWQIYTYKGTGGTLNRSVIGTFKQIPLKPAYAITIHKSQGQTFDNVIVSPKVFAAGQLYVALSRVRNAKGLRLTEPIKPEYLIANKKAEKFIKDGYKWEQPKKSLQKPSKSAQKVKKKTVKSTRKVKKVKSTPKATKHTIKRTTRKKR